MLVIFIYLKITKKLGKVKLFHSIFIRLFEANKN
jgi:hypothetical protein